MRHFRGWRRQTVRRELEGVSAANLKRRCSPAPENETLLLDLTRSAISADVALSELVRQRFILTRPLSHVGVTCRPSTVGEGLESSYSSHCGGHFATAVLGLSPFYPLVTSLLLLQASPAMFISTKSTIVQTRTFLFSHD